MKCAGLLLLALSASLAPARAQKTLPAPDDRAPDIFAGPHQYHGWHSKARLRFFWTMPGNFDPMVGGHDLTVILHGQGFDYRWGMQNHPAGKFRPDDVVISVDGTSPDNELRWFATQPKDAEAFEAFLTEMRPIFKVARVFLYGHGQGGTFATYFAALHPDEIAGVVLHSSVPHADLARNPAAHGVAIGLLAGTIDPEAPYRRVLDARDALVAAGFPLVHLRRLEGASFERDPTRADELLRWCDAATSSDPAEVLASARELSSNPTKRDQQTPLDFGAARALLRRIEGLGPAPLKEVDAGVAADAKTLIDKLEAAGAEHVAALRKAVPKKRDLHYSATLPLGHFVSLREDWRGVDAVEAYFREIGYDELVAAQKKTVQSFFETWSKRDAAPRLVFDAALDAIAKGWACDGWPFDLAEKMQAWHEDAVRLGLSSKGLKRYPELEAWTQAWKDGIARHVEINGRWTGP